MIYNLLKKRKRDNDDEILKYLHEEVQTNKRHHLLMKEGEKYSSLEIAVRHQRSSKVVLKLVEVGGRDLVMTKDSDGETVLHIACSNSKASIDVVSKLIEVGGRDFVMANCHNNMNALHLAIIYRASIEVVSKLIEVGRPAVLQYQSTRMH